MGWLAGGITPLLDKDGNPVINKKMNNSFLIMLYSKSHIEKTM
ncbi:DUF6440 family protein [Gottfriedia acidiceleris]